MHGYQKEELIDQPFDLTLRSEDMDSLKTEIDELMNMDTDQLKALYGKQQDDKRII